jgi:serine/threonine protein kinase
MRPEIVADPDLQGRFAQEARISAMIQSRHVVAVTDAGLESGIPFLVMELLAGVELGDVLRDRGPLSAPLAGTIVLQLARGLDKAHGAGVVHRDLKPENVYLTRDEDGALVVKILDFGIAKLLQGVSTHTVAGGTPLYMAPEQTRKGALSHAVDVWGARPARVPHARGSAVLARGLDRRALRRDPGGDLRASEPPLARRAPLRVRRFFRALRRPRSSRALPICGPGCQRARGHGRRDGGRSARGQRGRSSRRPPAAPPWCRRARPLRSSPRGRRRRSTGRRVLHRRRPS